jgi:hypothetical protein
MLTKNTFLSRRSQCLYTWVSLILIAGFYPTSAEADCSITASKACAPAGPPGVPTGESLSFELKTAQEIAWKATYTSPEPPLVCDGATHCCGRRFFLSRDPIGHVAEIELTSFAGETEGTKMLDPGIYFIAIKDARMGEGSYTVFFDRGASLSLTSDSPAFPAVLPKGTSTLSFTIVSSFSCPVKITSITSSKSQFTHAESLPFLIPPKGSKTFPIRFKGGTSVGIVSAVITVAGAIDATAPNCQAVCTVSSPSVKVSGETALPKFECVGPTEFGPIEQGDQIKFNISFTNKGPVALTLTGFDIAQSETFGRFFAFDGTPSLAPLNPGDPPRDVSIKFGTAFFECVGCGTNVARLIVRTEELGPVECQFQVIVNAFGGGRSVPTLSQWGLIIMSLLLLTAGTIFIMRRGPVIAQTATAGGYCTQRGRPALFERKVFLRVGGAMLPLCLIGLAIAGWASDGVETLDVAGTLLCTLIVAYIVHLLALTAREPRSHRQ